MKIIYIIITHGEPSHFFRLIEKLDGPDNRFIVHVDQKTKDDIFLRYKQVLNNRSNIMFIPRIPVYWGDFSIIEVEFNAMTFIRENGFEYDYAILISGAHYPIKSKEAINEYLCKNKGSLFLEHNALPTGPTHPWTVEEGGMNRILYWHFMQHPLLEYLIFWRLLPILKRLRLNGFLKRKYKFDLKLFGGSQWWCLDKAAIDYILNFVEKNKELISFFKFSKIPDEMLIQIILMNSPHKDRIINENLVYLRWPSRIGEPSPCLVSLDELSTLAQSNKLFARKFDDTSDQRLFDEIDRVCKRL